MLQIRIRWKRVYMCHGMLLTSRSVSQQRSFIFSHFNILQLNNAELLLADSSHLFSRVECMKYPFSHIEILN